VKLFVQVNKFILAYACGANNGQNVGGTCEHAANSKHTEFGKIVSIIASFVSLLVEQELLGVK
jgi:hypothetical protein